MPGKDDAKDFQRLVSAMELMGIQVCNSGSVQLPYMGSTATVPVTSEPSNSKKLLNMPEYIEKVRCAIYDLRKANWWTSGVASHSNVPLSWWLYVLVASCTSAPLCPVLVCVYCTG